MREELKKHHYAGIEKYVLDSAMPYLGADAASEESALLTIQTTINELESLETEMIQALYDNRPVQSDDLEKCKVIWNTTHWHKIIANRIEELKKELE